MFEEVVSKSMNSKYFAEGATVIDDETVYQLTYKSGDILTWKIEKEYDDEITDIELVDTQNLAR